MQKWRANRKLGGGCRPPAGWTPRQQRCQHEIGSDQAYAGQHLIEHLTFRSGKRLAAAILLPSRRLTDDQRGAERIAGGEHHVAGGVAQRAPVEARDSGAQLVQVGGLSSQHPRPLDRRASRRFRQALDQGRLGLNRTQPVQGIGIDRLIGTPLDLQAQQGKDIIQSASSKRLHPSRAARKRSRSMCGTRFFRPSWVAGPSVTRSRMNDRLPPSRISRRPSAMSVSVLMR